MSKKMFFVTLGISLLLLFGLILKGHLNSTSVKPNTTTATNPPSGVPLTPAAAPVATLDENTIPKFVNQLSIPSVYSPTIITNPKTGAVISYNYTVDMSEFQEQILPQGFPSTKVWGYGGIATDLVTGKTSYTHSTPGPTFEAIRGIPIIVNWKNNITNENIFPVDPTIDWANPNNMPMEPSKPWPAFAPGFSQAQSVVPTVPHLHGGETASIYDGYPEAWFTSNSKNSMMYTTSTFTYPNTQLPTTLWYHDHSLGMTRTNVVAGLSGFYILRDMKNLLDNPTSPKTAVLPQGKYDIPLAIQDRSFNADGSMFFDSVGDNPSIHPYWMPEFFGNTIVVNGKAWPNFNVERREYRFRVLNGSNARFYNLSLSNNQTFTQIGTDGGYLPAPVKLTSLLIAPGERADILIDFSNVKADSSIILKNDAIAPYPSGDKPDPNTVGQIMKFTIPKDAKDAVPTPNLPIKLNDIPKLVSDKPTRILTLNEVEGPDGPQGLYLNGQAMSATVSETPIVGSTEDWEIVNLSEDAHPIHLHLVQFQLVNRQNFDAEKYKKDWTKANGQPPLMKATVAIPVEPYLDDKPISPMPNETGWKDTIQASPGQITHLRIRFAPQYADPKLVKAGVNLFPFDPTIGPGYVWHCHILDHEDNEMMRPLKLIK